MLYGAHSARGAAVKLAVLCILFLASATALMGQTSLGSVEGLITDSSAAMVPGAEITLTETQTGITRTVPFAPIPPRWTLGGLARRPTTRLWGLA
ncbi:MAG: carboxypeptidase-like regulatory domain-containing protein [Terriglobia bacterium]|jgi:hypothetical protein